MASPPAENSKAELAEPALASAEPVQAARLLDAVLRLPVAQRENRERTRQLEPLLGAQTPAQVLQALFGAAYPWQEGVDWNALRRQLDVAIAQIDRLLERQVNAILHHPRFQQLEASWRGLYYLYEQVQAMRSAAEDAGEEVDLRIRVLNVSKRELFRDLDSALDFDQSEFFKKVYEQEFGQAGGTPYGLLIGDFEFTNHPSDIQMLERVAQVAAAAFAPFIASAGPHLLGLDQFTALQQPIDIQSTFQQTDYIRWRALRDYEDTRFLGLALPRVLMRVPYSLENARAVGFRFQEDLSGPEARSYLWGSPAYAFGAVVARAYAQSGWFADIRGAERNVEGGGLVNGLPLDEFRTDSPGVASKFSTEMAIDDLREKELSQLGFVPLCHCQGTPYCVFYTNQSLHKPRVYDDEVATANARISSMLQYVLCTSRFAHYVKVLARNWLGATKGPGELQSILNNWINQYATPDERASPDIKARFPLREASIEVEEILSQPGNYRILMHLLPHYQLDDLSAALRLVTRVDGGSRS